MNIVNQFSKLTANHTGLVFFDEVSARNNELINTIGRYDPETDELQLLDDESPIVRKFKALADKIYHIILPVGNGKYFVCFDQSKDISESLSPEAIKNEIGVMEAMNNKSTKPTTPLIRKVLFRDTYVGTLETLGNDEYFYLDDEFREAEGHEFDFYESVGEDDVLIDDVKSKGIDILNSIIDNIDKKKPIKENENFESFDDWYLPLTKEEKNAQFQALLNQRENNSLIYQTLKFME